MHTHTPAPALTEYPKALNSHPVDFERCKTTFLSSFFFFFQALRDNGSGHRLVATGSDNYKLLDVAVR